MKYFFWYHAPTLAENPLPTRNVEEPVCFCQDDALLLDAGEEGFDVVGQYLVSVMLRAWLIGKLHAASLSDKKHRRGIRNAGLPLKLFKLIAESHNWPVAAALSILEQQTIRLPSIHYFDLFKNSFVRVGCEIFSVGQVVLLNWTANIRSHLLRGGPVAQRYGKMWEDLCARVLAEYGWIIVAKNIKIRANNQTLTDIDILTAKGDLLLVIQFKAVGISGDTIYDHWLVRSKIERGVEQAKLAAEELQRNEQLLKTLLTARKIKEQPLRIQPLVVTTSSAFSGWNPSGIPVTAFGNMVSVLNGANVRYTTEDGNVVSNNNFIAGNEATTAEFLGFLQEPLDWRMADEVGTITHRSVKSDFACCEIPELVRANQQRVEVGSKDVSFASR